jgi:hypothetical protein
MNAPSLPPFNPFADVAVGNPWRSKEPDVETINSEAYAGLLGLISQLGATPNLAALVLGMAGGGKTHLIKRLISAHDIEAVYVYIHPLKDRNRIFTSLMEQVASNLEAHPTWVTDPGHVTQLDLVVANVIAAAFENHLLQNPEDQGRTFLRTIKKWPLKILSFASSPKWADFLLNTHEFLKRKSSFRSPMSKKVLKAIFQYVDKSKRQAVGTFLSGTIPDEKECKALNLEFSEGDWTIEAQEQRSKEILKAIGGLLEFYRPMVLCFDQLDSLESAPLVRAMGTLFMDIVNETENILPVGFVRPENWDARFKKILDPAAEQRMASNPFSLTGCNLKEALQLVESRLAWAYEGVQPRPPDPFFPLDRATLQARLQGITSPRQIITVANQLFLRKPAVSVEDPLEVLRASFTTERERILALTEQEPARQDTVVAALKLCFENCRTHKGRKCAVVDCSNETIKLAIRSEKGSPTEKTAILRVETAAHWRPLSKAFAELSESLNSQASDFSIVLRDERMPIPSKKGGMPKTVEKLTEFEAAGGKLIYIDYKGLADLYALVYTEDKVNARDLSYIAYPDGQRKEVERAVLVNYIRDEFRSELIDQLAHYLLGTPTAKGTGAVNVCEEEIIQAMEITLSQPPFKFKAEQIVRNLAQKGIAIKVTPDLVAQLIGKHSDRFEQLAVTPPIYYLKSGGKT